MSERITVTEREPDPGQQWKCGDEFLPFHPQASHIPPEYRDGWNRCYWMAVAISDSGTPDKLIEAAITKATGAYRLQNAYDYEDVFACCEAALAAAIRDLISRAKASEGYERWLREAAQEARRILSEHQP